MQPRLIQEFKFNTDSTKRSSETKAFLALGVFSVIAYLWILFSASKGSGHSIGILAVGLLLLLMGSVSYFKKGPMMSVGIDEQGNLLVGNLKKFDVEKNNTIRFFMPFMLGIPQFLRMKISKDKILSVEKIENFGAKSEQRNDKMGAVQRHFAYGKGGVRIRVKDLAPDVRYSGFDNKFLSADNWEEVEFFLGIERPDDFMKILS